MEVITADWFEAVPTAQHRVTSGQLTDCSVSAPTGADALNQWAPASWVATITPTPWPSPTATQWVTVGHVSALSPAVPAGACSKRQARPLSVLTANAAVFVASPTASRPVRPDRRPRPGERWTRRRPDSTGHPPGPGDRGGPTRAADRGERGEGGAGTGAQHGHGRRRGERFASIGRRAARWGHGASSGGLASAQVVGGSERKLRARTEEVIVRSLRGLGAPGALEHQGRFEGQRAHQRLGCLVAAEDSGQSSSTARCSAGATAS